MTKEEKDLLLQELCARLPYGVKCQIKEFGENFFTLKSINIDYKNGHLLIFEEKINGLPVEVYLSEVKPCLLPLSSMTDEQKREYNFWKHEVFVCHYEYGDVVEEIELFDSPESFDYLIENKFDCFGLIPKGLANDATDKNIY